MESRYIRQINVDHVGIVGQGRLQQSRVLIAGLGGVGSAASIYLGTCGVGRIDVLDDDVVSEHNLHRQILYDEIDVGQAKVNVAQERIRAKNSQSAVNAIHMHLNDASSLKMDYDLVLDCFDSLPSRFALAHYCVQAKVPLISAGARGWGGFIFTQLRAGDACIGCFLGLPGRERSDPGSPGVMGMAAGMAGILQASEAARFLLGGSERQHNYGIFDLWGRETVWLSIARRNQCPVCG
jgi:molybdopterin/thiamine biosynthesis adenylyltransferase